MSETFEILLRRNIPVIPSYDSFWPIGRTLDDTKNYSFDALLPHGVLPSRVDRQRLYG
jgi:hypothetical protein